MSPAAGTSGKILENLPPDARVLLVRMRSLGDTLLLTPAIRRLKQWRPDLRLSVLLYEDFAPALQGNPDLEEVIVLRKGGLGGLLSAFAIWKKVRQQKFHLVVNLHGGTMSALLTWFCGAEHRLAGGPLPYRFAYTAMPPPLGEVIGHDKIHCVEVPLGTLQWAGLPPGDVPPMVLVPQEDARRVIHTKLQAAGLAPGERYAVMVPVARFATLEWPFERYGAIARYLKEKHGLTSVLDCLSGEEWKLDAVDRAYGSRLPRLVPLSIPELAALIDGAELFVGNDSGPAHIAAALQRPSVVLYGSSDSVVWRPWRAPHRIVQNPYDCNPCRGDRCYAFKQPECILSLRVEQVQGAIDSLLQEVSGNQTDAG